MADDIQFLNYFVEQWIEKSFKYLYYMPFIEDRLFIIADNIALHQGLPAFVKLLTDAGLTQCSHMRVNTFSLHDRYNMPCDNVDDAESISIAFGIPTTDEVVISELAVNATSNIQNSATRDILINKLSKSHMLAQLPIEELIILDIEIKLKKEIYKWNENRKYTDNLKTVYQVYLSDDYIASDILTKKKCSDAIYHYFETHFYIREFVPAICQSINYLHCERDNPNNDVFLVSFHDYEYTEDDSFDTKPARCIPNSIPH